MNSYKYSRERLFGILVECPYAKDVQECPLSGYRTGDLKERAHMVFKTMSDSEVREMLDLHENCGISEISNPHLSTADLATKKRLKSA